MIRIENEATGRMFIYFPGGYVVYDTYRGEEHWYDDKGRLNRPNGLPAVVGADGYESYWEHGHAKT